MKKQHILLFGDSNTFGYMPGGAGRFDADTRYPGVLRRLLGDGYEVVEDGLNGRTTVFDDPYVPGRCGLSAIEKSVANAAPDLIVIMLGNNDCKSFYHADAARIADGAVEVAEAALKVAPNAKVLLCAPPALDPVARGSASHYEGEGSFAASRGLPEAFSHAAHDHGYEFLDANAAASPDLIDGEHLNASGHAAFAAFLADKIRSMA